MIMCRRLSAISVVAASGGLSLADYKAFSRGVWGSRSNLFCKLSFFLDGCSVTSRSNHGAYLGTEQALAHAVNDAIGLDMA